ncbi:MAG: hypothetical protein JWP15_2527 [Alphaproteobacteria bacterium]|nr:hypothetical protein [Alphaproteobacteria bacterium]
MAQGPRLFRLNIEVGNLEAAADFYGELLDQAGRRQMGGRCYFDVGAVTLQVVRTDPVQTLPKALYFAVGDLDAMHRRASALGCLAQDRVHGMAAGEPVVRPWGERSFYAADPWGNPLCFVEDGTIYAG